jgi:hypothetical protein
MKRILTAFTLVIAMCCSGIFLTAAGQQQTTQQRHVVINGVGLNDQIVAALESTYRTRIQEGEYWYDTKCGAWGFAGGPTVGFIQAGLPIGGPLRADASNGNTNIFINGREIHYLRLAASAAVRSCPSGAVLA